MALKAQCIEKLKQLFLLYALEDKDPNICCRKLYGQPTITLELVDYNDEQMHPLLRALRSYSLSKIYLRQRC